MSTTLEKSIFNRTSLLVGDDVMDVLRSRKVIIFGVGGVGSWCAEGLIRSGITHLTIVDADCVCASNVNRQGMATTKTIGQVKVEALKNKLLEINPEAQIEALREVYSDQTAESFGLDGYDYIVDAIDSLKDKASLILRACKTDAVFFSAMGAALKMDPTKVCVAEFWDVRGCPLGAALRKKLRKNKTFPDKPFLCVYDEEVLPNRGTPDSEDNAASFNKAVTNGTVAHITAIFGFTLSGLVLNDIYQRALA